MLWTQLLICMVLTYTLVSSQKKDTDEGRPYEFGFTIDGQQHRHEKKDENGIIQGEFGFITADGVYHVTVYATDENGNFKILSMRNVRISAPLDGSPGPAGPLSAQPGTKVQPNPLQAEPQPLPPVTEAPVTLPPITQPPTTQNPLVTFTLRSTLKPACASCGYVETKKLPLLPFQIARENAKQNAQNNYNNNNFNGQQLAEKPINSGQVADIDGNTPNANLPGAENPAISTNLQGPQETPNYPGGQIQAGQQSPQGPTNNNDSDGVFNLPNHPSVSSITNNNGPGNGPNQFNYNNNLANNRNGEIPNSLSIQEQANPLQLPPISVDNKMIHVAGDHPQDIAIKDKFPGMTDGLPEGINEGDIKDLLYKFHYTVGFHGHYEKGLKNGAKVGGYFVNGRDGVSRVVTYVADENGYRPKFKFVRLGLDSDETPKEATEKSFGLKSFEFVWYPVS